MQYYFFMGAYKVVVLETNKNYKGGMNASFHVYTTGLITSFVISRELQS